MIEDDSQGWHDYNIQRMREKEVRYQLCGDSDPEFLFVAYGSMFRVGMWVIDKLRKKGQRWGLLRPITLWPFPYDIVNALAEKVSFMFVLEMSEGQMVEDVRLGSEGRCPVHFYGRMGGGVPDPEEVLGKIEEV